MKNGSAEIKVIKRKFPIGAEVTSSGIHFRVWSPSSSKVEVVFFDKDGDNLIEKISHPLSAEPNGYFSADVENSGFFLYKFRLNNNTDLYPDPASRFQPFGPHGPSQIINPEKYKWTDQSWKGRELKGQVIYEIHIGTFTKEGTWVAAAEQLHELAEIGITVLEIMPIAEFAGTFGWGYDGVNLFAPYHVYGKPEDLKYFINEAHKNNIAVILDVVYNHLGPDGNYLGCFSKYYFTNKHKTDWGDAINFDGEKSEFVREYFITNAKYWIEEYHFDGFRIDATQDIYDDSPKHILAKLIQQIKKYEKEKELLVIAENEPQQVKLLTSLEKGGYGFDAVWNDDFHHSAIVALTGHNEAYYTDYLGKAQEFISSIKWGYLFQGQRYKWQQKRRGTPTLNINPEKFVLYIQNHDQVANSGKGIRIDKLTSPGNFKAMTALLLLAPGTPMLFQGEEFAASTPFLYFADHKEELSRKIGEGRAKFLAQFRSLATPEMQNHLPFPGDIKTFERSKLNFNERELHKEIYNFHKDLLRIRKEISPFNIQRKNGVDGAVLNDNAFVLRFFSEEGDKILLINLGTDLHFNPAPEPLLAPPESSEWEIFWSSEDPKYGGYGIASVDTEENFRIPGHAAVILSPKKIFI